MKKKNPRVKKARSLKVIDVVTFEDHGVGESFLVKKYTDPEFTVTLQLDKTTLEGKGATVLEALRAIKKPVKITTKSILTVQKGDKKHSRGLTIPLAKRLFYPGAQIYQAKNLEMLLK